MTTPTFFHLIKNKVKFLTQPSHPFKVFLSWGIIALFVVSGTALGKEPPLEAPKALPSPTGKAPEEDILIEGIGFAKLVVSLAPESALGKNPVFKYWWTLLEKNLCWSGVFNLRGGKTRYCGVKSRNNRTDMRLELKAEAGKVIFSLKDTGEEELELFKEILTLPRKVHPLDVRELVNRMTERITGHKGLLGSAIAMVLRQPGYAKVIVATNTHGDRLKLISRNRDVNLLPKWNPSGNALVYTVLTPDGSKVYFHNLAGNNGSSRFITSTGTLNTGGTFSPGGEELLMTMSLNQNADLVRIHLKTKKIKQVTRRRGIETQVHWAPQGKNIVFVSDRTGTPQVYRMDLDTNEELRLTFDSSYNADPKFSPDGQHILFTKRVNGREQIYIMDPNGENVRPVTRGIFDSEQPEWSPDGRQISFSSNRTGVFKIYIVAADGSNLRRLTSTPARFEESSPSWTANKLLK